MITEYDPMVTDLASPAVFIALMLGIWMQVSAFIQTNAQAIVVAGLICTIIVLMDWLANSKRRLQQAMQQNEFFVDVLRRVHPLTNGESNMSKDIQRVVTARLFSYPEVKRISARLMKSAMDDMVRSKKLSPDDRDILAEQLALQTGAWELYPKRKVVLPTAQELKDQIKARLIRVDPSKVIATPIPGATPEPPLSRFEKLKAKMSQRKLA